MFSTYPCAFLFPIASGSIPIPGYFRVSHGTGHFGFASAAPSVEKSRLPFQRVALRVAITDRFESYRINNIYIYITKSKDERKPSMFARIFQKKKTEYEKIPPVVKATKPKLYNWQRHLGHPTLTFCTITQSDQSSFW